MLHAVIMAGGSGTRFWPKSRRNRPKQLLKLFGDATMLQQTVARIAPLVPPERVLIITGEDQAAAVREQLPEVPAGNVIGEPAPRDTAPCVGLAASIVAHRDPDGTMIVLSADHRIEPAETFRTAVRAAVAEVDADPLTFITFGVRPTRPETGYGYIEQAEQLGETLGVGVYRVARFQEKPDAATARTFLEAGNYVWNAGIFVWSARAVLEALRQYQPEITERLDRIGADLDTDRAAATLAREFPQMTRLPIDKAVMERYPNVRVLEVRYDWSDVGDWRSLADLLPRDDHNNVVQGPARLVDSRGTVIIADDGAPVVTLGVDDLVIVQSGGVTLVARRDKLDALKGLVEGLEGAGFGELL
jgi:mannose-1-phosphate guanylyltransferase